MNDRPEGGAADLSDNSTIELMQHRRQSTTDNYLAIGESLNELDDKKLGIKVNAEYNMQIFNYTKGYSMQRAQQVRTDQPLQYLFAFDFESKQPKTFEQIQPVLEQGVSYQAFPVAKGKILVRLENLSDQFDRTA